MLVLVRVIGLGVVLGLALVLGVVGRFAMFQTIRASVCLPTAASAAVAGSSRCFAGMTELDRAPVPHASAGSLPMTITRREYDDDCDDEHEHGHEHDGNADVAGAPG